MSYSRWGNSNWYTYWDVGSGDTKDTQIFTICGETSFTYKDLKCGIEACILKLKPSLEEEQKELKGYMQEFIRNIDEEYKNES